MFGRWLIGGFAAALLIGSAPLGAQLGRPLAPLPPDGLRVAPFFDGFYVNPDGSTTMSFGYSNLNLTQRVEIPVGPDNFIEPKEFDGAQPTTFEPGGPENGRGNRRERERGVFTVTTPPGFRGEVVWTLRYLGQTHRVPGSARTGAYQLRWPMAMGSIPPILRFTETGPEGRGPAGIQAASPMQAKVGTPLPLTVWVHDDSEREPDPPEIAKQRADNPAMHVVWYKFSGPPGPVEFGERRSDVKELQASVSTTATFTQPGDYVLRARVDNFGRLDTSAGNQCCWTNGYVKVTVTP